MYIKYNKKYREEENIISAKINQNNLYEHISNGIVLKDNNIIM